MYVHETWWGWSAHGPLQVLLFFGLGRIQDGAKTGHGGVPFFNELLLQTGRLQQQTECIAMI